MEGISKEENLLFLQDLEDISKKTTFTKGGFLDYCHEQMKEAFPKLGEGGNFSLTERDERNYKQIGKFLFGWSEKQTEEAWLKFKGELDILRLVKKCLVFITDEKDVDKREEIDKRMFDIIRKLLENYSVEEAERIVDESNKLLSLDYLRAFAGEV
ncbi:MAG: hypothetical protein WC309_01515 [Candidatus Paceibacterota bacterium]|jgi:hypothetical protein